MRNVDKKIWLSWKFVGAMLIALASTAVSASEWPQELTLDGGTIVVYQPQPESLKGKTFAGRAAMSIEIQDKEPIYGVFWFTSTIETDRSIDAVSISNVAVTKVTWPDSKDTDEQRFTQIAEKALDGATFDSSLAALTSSLATAENVKKSLDEINNDPPQIKFSQELSVLLSYDGKPHFQAVEDSPFERSLNTPLVVVRDTRTQQYFLTSGSLWYEAKDALGPWMQTTNPPSDLVAMIPKSDEPVPVAIPAIVVVTEATELVVSAGAPNWVSLAGAKLLYVDNTETPWLRDLAGGNMYLQLSGRWFRSESEQGPWTFVRGDKLPTAFMEIPPASAIGGVRSSVAGTEEANDAVADAQIPQTTAIKRDEASLTVMYDGKPDFEDIKGTQVAYAVNTAAQVLRIDGKYYAVDSGVWFISVAATGPWIVADTIPSDEIAKIPPSSPVYNTTYVTIYNATPEVVYVGYTPGYMWSYPYYGVPVYGTGYYYPPYYGNFYYPRAPTWGFHVGYNPWTGWNYGVSWGGPFLRVGVVWGGGYGHGYYPGRCCGGRYGGGYHHNDIDINVGDINIGNNINVGDRRHGKAKISNRQRDSNIYSNERNRHRNADRATASANMKKARSNSGRKNNVFASKDGQVARRDVDQWQVRDKGKWNNVALKQKPTRDSVKSRDFPRRDVSKPSGFSKPASRPAFNHSNMNQHLNARSRGARTSGRVQRPR